MPTPNPALKTGVALEVLSATILTVALLVERHNNTFARKLVAKDGKVTFEKTITTASSTQLKPKVERIIGVTWEQGDELFAKTFNDQNNEYHIGDKYPLWVSKENPTYGIEYRPRTKETTLKTVSGVLGMLGAGLSIFGHIKKS